MAPRPWNLLESSPAKLSVRREGLFQGWPKTTWASSPQPGDMPLRQDTSASVQVVAFMIAAALFVGALATVLYMARGTPRDTSGADAAAQDVQAESLADILVTSAGVGWASGPDSLGRLGLAAYNGSGLQQSSINALKGAFLESAANGKVDYHDAQASLGLAPGGAQDFHIRVYPVGMDTVYDSSLSGLKVAYVGDWVALPAVTVPLLTPDAQVPGVANSLLNLSMAPLTASERTALDQLGFDFANHVHITSTNPSVMVDRLFPLSDQPATTYLGVSALVGDVYPDNKQYLDAVFSGRLAQYDVLVIGSGVDHSSLTANVVKDAIRDWTLAGGTLVVLGSSSQAYQWLQPLFFTGVATVNGAALAPDVAHPLLKEPNELDWTSYDSHGRGWDIKDRGTGAHYDDFSHVIVQGGEDVMAISKDGAFGAGRILLTTYMPREFSGGLQETMNFFENVALFADRAHLYLEYGPTAPPNTAVSIAVRQSWLYDDLLGQVPVTIEIATWASA